MDILSENTFFYVSEIIIFIVGHRVQFDVTYVTEILPISTTINSLSLITKVATGERLSMPHKAEGLSVLCVCWVVGGGVVVGKEL